MRTPTLRERAGRRLQRPEDISDDDWARMVEEASKRGLQLLRFPGLIVQNPRHLNATSALMKMED